MSQTGPDEEHHPLGPSTLKHVEICPGFRSTNEQNVFTIEGTRLHEACETRKFEGLDDEQSYSVGVCLTYVDKLGEGKQVERFQERKLTIALYTEDEPIPEGTVYTEITGTADLLVCNSDEAHIDLCDYKFGRGAIDDASVNIQGQAYAVGAMDLFPWAKTCTVAFIIPRRDEITTHTYKREELEDLRFRTRLIIERATQPEPELNPRTEVCRFCKERLSCPALRQNLLPIASKHAGNNFAVELLQKYSPSQVRDPEVLAKMVEVAPVMEKWASEAKKHAAQVAMETGDAIPGYTLRYRNAQKRLDNATEVANIMNLEFGIDKSKFLDACTPSFTKLINILSSGANMTKVEARSKLELSLIESGHLPESDEKTAFLVKS
jgi:hypothetical protein